MVSRLSIDTSLSTSATWWKGERYLLSRRIRDMALRSGFVLGKVCMSVQSLMALLQSVLRLGNVGLCLRYAVAIFNAMFPYAVILSVFITLYHLTYCAS